MLTCRERFVKNNVVLRVTCFASYSIYFSVKCLSANKLKRCFQMHDTYLTLWRFPLSIYCLLVCSCGYVIRKCHRRASFACSCLFVNFIGSPKDKSVTSRWTASWHIFHSSLVEARAFVLASVIVSHYFRCET